MKESKKSNSIALWIAVHAVLLLVILIQTIALVRTRQENRSSGEAGSTTNKAVKNEASGTQISDHTGKPAENPHEIEPNEPQRQDADAPDAFPLIKGGVDEAVNSLEEAMKRLETAAEERTPSTDVGIPDDIPVLFEEDYRSCDTTAEEWCFERKPDHTPPSLYRVEVKNMLEENSAYYLNTEVLAGDKVIYLSFDCGQENGYTASILDTLKAHHAQAIFFVTEPYIQEATELVLRMKEEGHLVGNHTVTHANLAECTTEQLVRELLGCATTMKEKTGYRMDAFLRPPEGAYSEKSLRIADALGYKTVFWSIAYQDWDAAKQPGKDYVVDHFVKNHHNGAIPLLHVLSESNMQALDEVLTLLENEGYRFGSVTEL